MGKQPSMVSMEIDDIYQYTGEMGVYQVCVIIIIFILRLFAHDATTMIFVGAEMPHWCRVDSLAHLPFERQKYIAIPYAGESSSSSAPPGGQAQYSSCKMFALNYSAWSADELDSWNRTSMTDDDTPVVDCQQWVYDQTMFVSSVVSKFNLVCGYAFLSKLFEVVYMVGAVLAYLFSGYFADRVGRMPAIMTFLAVKLVGMYVSSFAPNYTTFTVGRFIIGVGCSGIGMTTYMLLMESIGPNYRAITGCALEASASLGFLLQPLIAKVVRDDAMYQVANMTPVAVFFAMPFIIEESVHWQIVTKRFTEAYSSLQRICTINGEPDPIDLDLTCVDTSEESDSFLVLFTLPRMRLRTIIIFYLCFTMTLVYVSLSLNLGALPGNIFDITTIAAAMEIPSIVIMNYLLEVKHLGRRINCCATFMLIGLACFICVPLVLLEYRQALIGLTIFAQSVAASTVTIVILYALELFPTEVRNSAIGWALITSSLATPATPFIGEPLSEIWTPLPYVVIGAVTVISGLATLILPETLGQLLPDTAQQAENFTGKTDQKDADADDEESDVVGEMPDKRQYEQLPPTFTRRQTIAMTSSRRQTVTAVQQRRMSQASRKTDQKDADAGDAEQLPPTFTRRQTIVMTPSRRQSIVAVQPRRMSQASRF